MGRSTYAQLDHLVYRRTSEDENTSVDTKSALSVLFRSYPSLKQFKQSTYFLHYTKALSQTTAFFKPFNKQALVFKCLQSMSWGKGEIVRDKQFLLFYKCFVHFWQTVCHFHQI